MHRRNFLAAALSGVGGLSLAACADDSRGLLAPGDEAQRDIDSTGCYLRRNIYCLNTSSYDVVAYRDGITAMKARPATDPTSWLAQANIHGASAPPALMLANLCKHGNYFFLSWHRMYLYYFERIVRSASGKPNFALPYWGYSPSGTAYRNLPAMFRSPNNATNPLWESNRSAGAHSGALMSTSIVSSTTALAQIPFNSFGSSLEGTPHGVVHSAVGGGMGSFNLAGRDPIFWLHHANIDRLWTVWKAQAGRFNPSDSTWLNTNFNFYDEAGSTITMKGAQILDTVAQLRYKYVSCLLPVEIAVVDKAWIARAELIAPRPPRPIPWVLSDIQVGVKLGASPVEVPLPISAETRGELQKFMDNPQGGNDIAVQFQDVALLQDPAVYYEVYANLPSGSRDTVYTSPHYVGNLDFFGAREGSGEHAEHVGMRFAPRLSLLNVYSYQKSQGTWRDEEVRLTFVPRPYYEGEDPAKLVQDAQAVVGRITLQLE
jgi:hypothetical protein